MSHDLNRRMNYSEYFNNASGVACVLGILLLGLGLNGAVLLNAAGIFINLGGAMLPLLTEHARQQTSEKQIEVNNDG